MEETHSWTRLRKSRVTSLSYRVAGLTWTRHMRPIKSCWETWKWKSLICLRWSLTSLTCSSQVPLLMIAKTTVMVASHSRSGCNHLTYSSRLFRTHLATSDWVIRHKTITHLRSLWVQGQDQCRTKQENPLKIWSWKRRLASNKEISWRRLTLTSRWENCQRNKDSWHKLASITRGSISALVC